MIDRDLIRHAAEFKARIAAHDYDVTDEGIFFPRANVHAFGEYVHDVNGQDERTDRNLIPTAGLNHLLSVTLAASTPNAAWYLSLYSGVYTPDAALTAATYPAAATEITSNTEGYSNATRPVWTPAAASAGTIDNLASRAAFTIATATTVTVRGAALTSISTKGAITGMLISASRFSADRVQYAGDVFNLGYRVRLQAA